MRKRSSTVHHQFAKFFADKEIQPLAYAISKNLEKQSICLDPHKDLQYLLEGWKEDQELKFTSSKEGEAGDQIEGINLNNLISYACHSGKYIGDGKEDQKPFIYNNGLFYIRRYFAYEIAVVDEIRRVRDISQSNLTERAQRLHKSSYLMSLINNRDKSEGQDWQLIASMTACLQNFVVITGGPGTGKTTTVAKILAILLEENRDLKVKLAAFTGKAGKRMEESLREAAAMLQVSEEIREKLSSFSALTLHRLLGFKKNSHYFRHNKENPIVADVVIIDEASMIDTPMFAKLLEAIGDDTRFILLGDQNQLASVEAGSVFGDLCNSVDTLNKFSEKFKNHINASTSEEVLEEGEVNLNPSFLSDHIVELKKSWRVKDNAYISEFSKAVLLREEGKSVIDEIFKGSHEEEKMIIDSKYDTSILKRFAGNFRNYIEEANKGGADAIKKALEELNKQRILSPVREGKQGIYNLNSLVEICLEKQGLLKLDSLNYENRPVMITRNNYELNVFNGDVGIIRYLNDTPQVYFINSKGELRNHPASYISDMETVFASTVHKSQGSEFEKVLVVLPKKFRERILTRELLYTGITRAKKQLILQGTKEIVLEIMGNTIKRASGITRRINEN